MKKCSEDQNIAARFAAYLGLKLPSANSPSRQVSVLDSIACSCLLIGGKAGAHFDPKAVELFLQVIREKSEIA